MQVTRLAIVVSWSCASAASAGSVVHVDDDAPPGGDGTSWETAYRFLGDAIDAADGAVTEIRVAQGTYRPDRDEANPDGTGDRAASFALVAGVAIRGGYLGLGAGEGEDPNERDVESYETVLTGDLLGDDVPPYGNIGDNSLHVLRANQVDDATLDGVTVTRGVAIGPDEPDRAGGGLRIDEGAVLLERCTFESNFALGPDGDPDDGGAAVRANDAALLVHDSTFRDNESRGNGGAIFARSMTAVEIIDTEFTNNAADGPGGGAYVWLDIGAPPLIVRRCTVTGNEVATDVIFPFGGGLYLAFCDALVEGCRFEANVAGQGGGMEHAGFSFEMTMRDCLFLGNTAANAGGGLVVNGSAGTIVDCLITGNDTAGVGGGVAIGLGAPFSKLINCTIVENTAEGNGGGVWANTKLWSPLLVHNCIVWGNVDQDGTGALSQILVPHPDPIVSYSCIEGWAGEIPGAGNTGADPQFVDRPGGNYRLAAGSPLIDAGHNWAVPPDVALDLDGNGRFHADEVDFDPGCGVPAVVDMGAYEYQFQEVEIVFADIDGDGVVGVPDLIDLILAWGPCDAGCCLPDLDLSGDVGVADLVALVTSWSG